MGGYFYMGSWYRHVMDSAPLRHTRPQSAFSSKRMPLFSSDCCARAPAALVPGAIKVRLHLLHIMTTPRFRKCTLVVSFHALLAPRTRCGEYDGRAPLDKATY